MRKPIVRGACACILAVTFANAAAAQPTSSELAVCLVLSHKLSMSARQTRLVLAELNTIWKPHRVGIRWKDDADEECGRIILVKSDEEALPEDASADSALGWVPFVAGRARQVLFVRAARVRMLVDSMSPGTRPEGLTDLLTAKLLGRSLAHEVGHVLLDSRTHEPTGLMRWRYRASDVLSEPTSSYSLSASEQARLTSKRGSQSRWAER